VWQNVAGEIGLTDGAATSGWGGQAG
jgi:hypothetical protein